MKCYFLLLFLEQRVMMLPTWDKAKGGTFWFQEGQIKDLWSFIQAASIKEMFRVLFFDLLQQYSQVLSRNITSNEWA